MTLLTSVALALGASLAMAAAWGVQRLTGRSGWIDTIWSAAVGLGGLAAVALADGGDPGRRVAVGVVAAAWSVRLALHIGARTRGSGEDPRYAALAAEWGPAFPLRLFLFLQVQAACAWVLILAIALAAADPAPFPRLLDGLAGLVALVALIGEAMADAQLARFRRDGASGGICEVGLWRWSRHPNYFFEWLGWCAWPLAAIDPMGGHPWGWAALAAPVLMYVLLVHASGIPPLEAHMAATRGEAFRSLQRRVNAFFPGPRRAG
ncbi:DUF1295 domain-containing protein [Siculibacillus lacustris]|uniref:DUF1295 domain-containing protein n=1 Tax=Siculibacillus lacustris TaxID=1549641 RepID=A0A4Q9VWK5_9HYPH|nr:DUF1295 domain-containing protein [Siculibacillus lacustris]TBW40710.1 DUF1295 domain-containing protein [Siculibacillus lacustris]